MKLVFIENCRPVTDSLTVAETFGKTHDKVLRDIRELECSKEFSLANFGESTYRAQNGQTYPKYLITQDGFSFLVMGYTGKEAARFKEMYIGEFNRMRDELSKPQLGLPQNYKEALIALVEQVEKTEHLEQQIKIQAPKVALYDVAMCATNTQSISKVAKSLGYGPNKLFKFLRDNKILMNGNIPYQRYIDAGYFEVRQIPITRTESIMNVTQPLVTAKGMAWIHKLLLEDGRVTA